MQQREHALKINTVFLNVYFLLNEPLKLGNLFQHLLFANSPHE